MITNWKTLKLGQHIKLSCGCQGFVVRVDLEGEEEEDTGFVLTYTGQGCGHRDGYGPYSNYSPKVRCRRNRWTHRSGGPRWRSCAAGRKEPNASSRRRSSNEAHRP